MADQTDPVQLSNKYDGIQVKHTLDDEVNRFFSSDEKYNTNHRHDDTKLALGYLSCIAAGGAFAYEYKHGFQASKHVLLLGVIIFWVLQAFLWLYTYAVERQQVFVGTKRDANKQKRATLTVSTQLDKFSPTYELWFEYCDYSVKPYKKSKSGQLQKNVASWISEEGVLSKEEMDKDLSRWLKDLEKKTHTN